jgi:hypothetical protein
MIWWYETNVALQQVMAYCYRENVSQSWRVSHKKRKSCSNSCFVTRNGLQLQGVAHLCVPLERERDFVQMWQTNNLSTVTHSSNLHHYTFMHQRCCPVLSDCCPIFTLLYCMSCILIATIGIILYLNYKKPALRCSMTEIIEFWELTLSNSATLCPPHCEKIKVQVILSLEIPSVQYRWHNSCLNNVSSKGLCRCKCV